MHLEVTVPDEAMGDVIGDLNSRRGKVLGRRPQAAESGDPRRGADGGGLEVRRPTCAR